MRIINNEIPELKLPEFNVDKPLTKHLEEDSLLKHMNKRFISAFIGKAGSGKTSLLVSFLQTQNKLKKVFNKIYVFMPNTSRQSLKDNIFEELPEDQLFEGVTFENLQIVYNNLLNNTQENLLSLLIFDDVQSYLKIKEVEVNVLHIIANSRHLRTSVMFAVQNYNKVPKNIRNSFTDLFLFNVSKQEYVNIFDENIELDKNEWQELLTYYSHVKQESPYSFIYIHEKTKAFINWSEVVFDEN